MTQSARSKGISLAVASALLVFTNSAVAVNLEAESAYPQVLFDDTGHAGNEWALVGVNALFAIQDVEDQTTILLADQSARSVGIGYYADSNASSSMAVGYNAETQGSFSTAVGYNALTTEWSATALGRDAVAGGSSSVALGEDATTAGLQNFAAGYGAYAVGERSAVLGWQATVEGDDSLALGRNTTTSAGATSSSAIGRGAGAYGIESLAIGAFARSDGSYSTAVGNARTQGADSVAVGRGADTELAGASGVAVGPHSLVSQAGGVALGYAAGAFSQYSTAVGPYAAASQPWTLVLGSIAGTNSAPEYTDVAIGTSDPLAPLHVHRDDGTAGFMVEETNAVVAPRTLMTLANPGNTKFEIVNTDAMESWAFTNSGSDFRVSLQGSGVVEFRVDNNGNAYVANNMELGGTLTELSDRNRKHAIVPLDGDAVLAKLAQVPVSEWSYDSEAADQRHIGPMAQDFYAAFGLASGETRISARDMAGVNMAALQALNQKLARENADIRAELAALKAMVLDLRSAVPSTGLKVATN